jgi:predicted nucleic acid-binding protein
LRVLLDTSCLVAASLAWHEHHQATAGELRRRARSRDAIVVAAHSLVEAYAVLTRLPTNRRIEPREAALILRESWSGVEVVGLTAAEHWAFLQGAADARILGGQAYDAMIAACARKADVAVVLTWNEGHFARFAGPFRVARPGQGSS